MLRSIHKETDVSDALSTEALWAALEADPALHYAVARRAWEDGWLDDVIGPWEAGDGPWEEVRYGLCDEVVVGIEHRDGMAVGRFLLLELQDVVFDPVPLVEVGALRAALDARLRDEGYCLADDAPAPAPSVPSVRACASGRWQPPPWVVFHRGDGICDLLPAMRPGAVLEAVPEPFARSLAQAANVQVGPRWRAGDLLAPALLRRVQEAAILGNVLAEGGSVHVPSAIETVQDLVGALGFPPDLAAIAGEAVREWLAARVPA